VQRPSTFELPTTDILTGLCNEAYARFLLREQLLPQADREGTPLSLMLIDLDSFLETNQRHGRRCGDHVLIHVARVLQATMPEQAVLARFGGDEFVAGLPSTRIDDTFTLAEDLRRRVAAIRLDQWPEVRITCTIGLASFPASGKRLPEDLRRRVAAIRLDQWPEVRITCTIGLASFPASGKRLPELVREADQALYVAKLNGRNKVALPLAEGRMITKTSYYTATQLERLAQLARRVERNEATLLREALDDVLKKYNDLLSAPPAADEDRAPSDPAVATA